MYTNEAQILSRTGESVREIRGTIRKAKSEGKGKDIQGRVREMIETGASDAQLGSNPMASHQISL